MTALAADELDCPRACEDVGYSYGLEGRGLGAMWADLERLCGPLSGWQRQDLEAGWRAGRRDREAYVQDMTERADAQPSEAGDLIPF